MKIEEQLNALQQQIDALESKLDAWHFWFIRNSLEKELEELKSLKKETLHSFLEINSKDYRDLVLENKALLVNDSFVCKVTHEGIGAGTAKEIEGNIAGNGYYYGNVSNYSAKGRPNYPKRFRGRIDFMGKSYLKLIESKYVMVWDRSVKSFVGKITERGDFLLVVDEIETTGASVYLSKIIADPFTSEAKRERFLLNCKSIEQHLSDFESGLLKQKIGM